MKTLAACLLSLSLLPACATTTASDYFLNRGGDLIDIVRANGKVGAGIGLKIEWTRWAQLGYMYEYNCWAAGLANRELAYWQESIHSWGLILGYHEETIHQGIQGRLSGDYGWLFGEEGGTVLVSNDPNNVLDMFNFRAQGMVGVGLDFDFRVGEIIDFLLGIFQFDPAHDDHAYSDLKQLEE